MGKGRGGSVSLADPGVAQRKRASWGHQRQLKSRQSAGNAPHRAALTEARCSLIASANASLNVNELRWTTIKRHVRQGAFQTTFSLEFSCAFIRW